MILRRKGHKPLVVGHGRRVVTSSGTVKLVLRVSRRVRVALAHHRRVTLVLKVVVGGQVTLTGSASTP